jgi:DNA/RNA-binding domain of Phe-tRNA-synthetase-like protein
MEPFTVHQAGRRVMPEVSYRIAPEIFAGYPGYVRGLLFACEVRNGPSPDALVQFLRESEAAAAAQLELATLAEHPRIKSWREAFRAFGAKPSEYKSSIEALARRALRADPLPSINALVDIGNLVSLRHLAPAGAHALDGVTGDLELRPATGAETFVALGSDVREHPEPGEIIFAEGETVLTRRWVWRQGQATLATPATTVVEFNIDVLHPASPTEAEEIGIEIAGLVARFCGGRTRFVALSAQHPATPIWTG